MHRIRSLYRRARNPRADWTSDLGFAMITVIGYGVIIVLIASLLAAYALASVKGSRREQDYDAGSGNVTVYAEGRSRAAKGSNQEVDRAVKVTLRKGDYTDYLYYSEVE